MTIRLHDLAPSPNNIKVRIALHFKGIPFERIPVPFSGFPPTASDRTGLVEISRQPLSPVLEHDGRVVFDSGAILRYLEANFRDTPPLFSAEREDMRQIEDWERFGRSEVPPPVGAVLRQAFAPPADRAVIARANEEFAVATARLEERLSGRDWLVGDRMTAADVTIAPFVFYGMVPEELAGQGGAAAAFHEHLHLGEGRSRTREWVSRVMAWEREPEPAA